MRNTGIIGILSLAALMMAGCQADESLDKLQGQVPIYLTATVSEPGNGTRAATDVQSGTQFGAGETFYAYFPTGVRVGETTSASSTSYTTDGSGGTTAATQPYFNTEATSANVCAYYPYVTDKQVTAATTSFSVETDQTAADGFKKSDLMYATSAIQKSSPTSSLSFSHKMAKIIVNVTLGAGISKVTGVRIVSGSKTIAIANPATTDETSAAYLGSVSTADADQITADDNKFIALYSGEYTSTTAALACAGLIPPQTIDAAFLQVVTAEGAATYSVSKAFASGAFYTYNITVNAAALGLTTAITEWDNQSTQYLFNLGTVAANVEAVDLGLSVKWAPMNVGATSETDYGMYFMWGDVVGRSVDGFHEVQSAGGTLYEVNDSYSFSLSNYKWYSGEVHYYDDEYGYFYSRFTYSKYVPTDQTDYWGCDGDPDNKLVLEADDDAATANWGRPWRTPTADNLEELNGTYNTNEFGENNDTHWKWTWYEDYNNSGHAGYLISYRADVSSITVTSTLFLPAAGHRDATYVRGQGYWANYMSSTFELNNPVYPKILYLYDGESRMAINARWYGLTVRPVLGN